MGCHRRPVMKFKFLATAFAVSFALTACDSGSSSTKPNESVIDQPDSGLEQHASDTEKTSNSSEGAADEGETHVNGATNEETNHTNNSSNINLNEMMTPEQLRLLRAFEAKMGDSDDSGKKFSEILNNGSCQDGDVQSAVYLGQNVQWTCIYEEWVPTSGFDKVVEAIPSETLNEILAESGLTKEELLAMIDFMSKMDVSKNDAAVVCDGELTDNFWKISMTGNFAGAEFLTKGDVTFEGDSMVTNSTMEMDLGTEATCKAYMNTDDDDDEDEDILDKEIYGDVVKSETKCNGSRMVQVEKSVKKNVTEESRKRAYENMLGKCKDYRDGKITYEELMMD